MALTRWLRCGYATTCKDHSPLVLSGSSPHSLQGLWFQGFWVLEGRLMFK